MPFDGNPAARPMVRETTAALAALAETADRATLAVILAECGHRDRKPARVLAERIAGMLAGEAVTDAVAAMDTAPVAYEVIPCVHGEVVPEYREVAVPLPEPAPHGTRGRLRARDERRHSKAWDAETAEPPACWRPLHPKAKRPAVKARLEIWRAWSPVRREYEAATAEWWHERSLAALEARVGPMEYHGKAIYSVPAPVPCPAVAAELAAERAASAARWAVRDARRAAMMGDAAALGGWPAAEYRERAVSFQPRGSYTGDPAADAALTASVREWMREARDAAAVCASMDGIEAGMARFLVALPTDPGGPIADPVTVTPCAYELEMIAARAERKVPPVPELPLEAP